MNVVYICYFGIRENLVQTQVIPYLKELASAGHTITLLTFEPQEFTSVLPSFIESHQNTLNESGLIWCYRKYHKKPSHIATIYDIVIGIITIIRLHKINPIQLLHARSHVPLIIALVCKLVIGCQILFDIRGLIADEYVDAGVWNKNSITYKLFKYIEQLGIAHSDALVVLTNKFKNYLVNKYIKVSQKITVIPCCTAKSKYFYTSEFTHYTENNKSQPTLNLIYAGSVSGLYLLTEMGQFFFQLMKVVPDAHIHILTHQKIHSYVHKEFRSLGIKDSHYRLNDAAPNEVPGYFKQATVGLSFRKPTFSQIAASPTKIPEYLMAGLPVIANSGVGDTDEIICDNNVGVLLTDFSYNGYSAAIHQLLYLLEDPLLSERCRSVAIQNFDLQQIGGIRYKQIYDQLSSTIARA